MTPRTAADIQATDASAPLIDKIRVGRFSGFAPAAVVAATLIIVAGCAPEPSAEPSLPPSATTTDVAGDFAELERRYDAALGVYAIDTGTGQTVEYRADDRFAHASTIKALAVGAVLDTASDTELDAAIPVDAGDVVPYSPIVETRVGGTVTLLEAADAAVRFSDNAAANILLDYLGGPDVLEQQLRDRGDNTTSVDRYEPELNDYVPGDGRATSTPRALATSLATYTLGDALDNADRALLVDLLRNNTTGDLVIRAGAPSGWVIGDKTGTADYGTRNDIAIAWPPGDAPPIVMAVLSNRADADAATVDELLADAAERAFDSFTTTEN